MLVTLQTQQEQGQGEGEGKKCGEDETEDLEDEGSIINSILIIRRECSLPPMENSLQLLPCLHADWMQCISCLNCI